MELTRKLLDSTSSTLADQRMVKVICSTGEPDRMGDVIVQSGIDLSAYRKNPIVLWGHSADVPIARAVDIDVKDGKLQATVQFPPEGDDEDSDWVYGKIKAGIVNAISVGFIPKEYEPLDPKQPWDGFKFATSELLEFSFVSVPANAGCLIVGRSLFNSAEIPVLPSVARSKGFEPADPDVPAHNVMIPRNILEEVFRQAKTPKSVRQKYLARAASAEWKVGAARDLPIDEAASWDGAAAAKRVLDDAGFDGDSPDAAKAARGFLIHDSANPGLRGSYKLPFADIVGGTLKAVKAGISAAKGRLDQTDAPAAVLDDAKAVLDAYEKRIGNSGGDDKQFEAPEIKAGRRISKANEALLRKAMDEHCANAVKCIKDVLDSIAPDDEPDDDHSGDQLETITVPDDKSAPKPVDMRAARLAEIKALRTEFKL